VDLTLRLNVLAVCAAIAFVGAVLIHVLKLWDSPLRPPRR